MDASDFRRIALSFEGAVESSVTGVVDFRVGGEIFAALGFAGTAASLEDKNLADLILSPEVQAEYIRKYPDLLFRAKSCWGKNGVTHVRLADAGEQLLTDVLRAAWTAASATTNH